MVVNTAPALEAIQAAKQVVRQDGGGHRHRSDGVATLATVTTLPPMGSKTVVVMIEYTRN
jgi:hypothetical protein